MGGVHERKFLQEKDQLMLDKDACIESLEKKVEILAHAKRVNISRAHNDYKQLSHQQTMFASYLCLLSSPPLCRNPLRIAKMLRIVDPQAGEQPCGRHSGPIMVALDEPRKGGYLYAL